MTDDETDPPPIHGARDIITDRSNQPTPAEIIEMLKGGSKEPPEAILSAIRMTLQSTRGNYPPPMMMEEYKKIDPAINQQILSEAKTQGDHRRGLEKFSTERSEKRLDKAQGYQQIVALTSLVAAVAIIGMSLYWTHSVGWPTAIAAALIGAVGIGGRPAATILTSYIAKRIPRI